MMQESGSETSSNGPASQNGGVSVSVDAGSREARARSATPCVEVTAADLLHFQQQQVTRSSLHTCWRFEELRYQRAF